MRFIKQNESRDDHDNYQNNKKPLYRNDFECLTEGLRMLHLDAVDFRRISSL